MVFDQAPAAVTRREPDILLETLRFPANVLVAERALPPSNLPLAKMKKSFYFPQRTEFAISLWLPPFVWMADVTDRHRRQK
jgi:hypothetical protein